VAYDNERASATFDPPAPMTTEERVRFERGAVPAAEADPRASPFTLTPCAEYRTHATVTTQQVFTGATLEVPIRRKITCAHCKGTGGDAGRIVKCKTCNGCGTTVRRMKHHIEGDASTIHYTHGCHACGTTGFIVLDRTGFCGWCGSRGYAHQDDALSVEVPAGIPTRGHRVRLAGAGHATPLRPPGDVVVDVAVDWDPRLRRVGADVYVMFRIRLVDALCGFHYQGDYFGEYMEFMSEPGKVIQTGDTLRVRGVGLPQLHAADPAAKAERGDLIVEFRVDMPSALSIKDQQLLRVILEQTPLRNAESRNPIRQEELDMRAAPPPADGAAAADAGGGGDDPRAVDSRADGCRPM